MKRIFGWGVALLILGACPAVTAQDRYFVSTFQSAPNGAVYEVDFGAGTVTLIVDGFHLPEDIAAKASTGELFICESLDSRVIGYDLATAIAFNVTPTAGFVEGPEGPSISPAGDLYINTRGTPLNVSGVWMVTDADPTNAVVNVVPIFGSFGEGSGFGRAGTSAGGLLAVDRASGLGAGTGKVVLSNPPGAAPIIWITGLTEPFGIAANSAGDIFVSERPLGQITQFDSEGNLIGPFITNLFGPSFLEVDSNDNVIVSDGGRRVLQIDPGGVIIGEVPVDSSIGVAVLLQPQGGECPLSQGFWKTHPASWPVDEITMGGETYTKAEARALLRTPVRGDASLILAKQLIAAKVNIENGSDAAPVMQEIADADSLLSGFAGKLPYGVRPGSTDGQPMTAIASVLDDYNNQQLTPNCVSTTPLGKEGDSGGCGAFPVGAVIGPADIFGSFLPWAAVLLALVALRWQGRRRPAPAWASRRA